MLDMPKVSIVIVNLNGKHHLSECFKSIQELNYPKDKIELIVVDNGSKDGSVELIQNKYSYIKLLKNTKNEGFAKPSNDGARAATGEYVAFLNNDMRVQKNWLIELVNSLRTNNAQCAGSVILNWDGKLLDFAGGGVNFIGLGFQDDFKKPIKEMESKLKEDKPLFFACGGAMLVNKEMFLFAGGFDEDYFAYYEDVDLGWRLRVLGCNIVLSVKSRVYHKHNSTSKTIASERVQLLFERNKLYTIYKNYGDKLFNKVFISALLLDIREAFVFSGIEGKNYDIENTVEFDQTLSKIPHVTALKLTALNDFVNNIAVMEEKRNFIQSNRKTEDADLVHLFEKPFIVFPKDTTEYLNTEYDMIKVFGLDKAFGKIVKPKILVISQKTTESYNEKSFASNLGIAEALSIKNCFNISFACENEDVKNINGVEYIIYNSQDFAKLIQAAKETNIVILPYEIFKAVPELKQIVSNKFAVVDLRVNSNCDNAFISNNMPEIGDFFICSSEKQKDYCIGMLYALNRIKQSQTNSTKYFKQLVTVVENFSTDLTEQLKPVIEYCLSPIHLKEIQPLGLLLQEQNFTNENLNFSDDKKNTLRERLNKIEQSQKTIERLLRENAQATKDSSGEVKEVLNWVHLMNSRFKKLKNVLSKIRIFNFLFK
jgi:GT2 family glycosyltransferase